MTYLLKVMVLDKKLKSMSMPWSNGDELGKD